MNILVAAPDRRTAPVLHVYLHVSRREIPGAAPAVLALALLLPVGVVLLGVYQYRLLITLFFTWASLHVLHQIIYLSDCYRRRAPGHEAVWSRVWITE